MNYSQPPATDLPGGVAVHAPGVPSASGSAVSWGAIVAGAIAAAALSMILLLLGSGLGLSSASPWSTQGASAMTLGVAGVFWITFTQLAASGMGGYLAGRLRTRWAGVHTDEVYFRDTAHGFLAWAVASLVTAAFLASAVGNVVGMGAKAGASVAGAAVTTAGAAGAAIGSSAGNASSSGGGNSSVYGYFVDSLFRPDTAAQTPAAAAPAPAAATGTDPVADAANAAAATPAAPTTPAATAPRNTEPVAASTVAEVGRIMVNSIRAESMPADDVRYVASLIAQRTGMTQEAAEKRVNDTYAKAKAKLQDAENTAREAADKARKASAAAALWLFVSLLIGAFVASYAATWGGRQRDL
ncbi:hypothetical protein [Xylophilus sp. Leaf220]|uniref:hypothetical protein n=1 Tax=Xylophilus sp. Leaf220 TaxID=1735686 RepID=UPI0006FE101F|nr:hypothetical protein [Xylophilus sp. Leaf220]KQM79449.1 hypothetical protein ASE76_15360 [Xylophilus sp. Leaf220]